MLRVRDVAIRSMWAEGRIGIRGMSGSFSAGMKFSCGRAALPWLNIEAKSRSWSASSLDSHIGLLAKKMFDIMMGIDLTSYLDSAFMGNMAEEFADLTR